LIRDRTEPKPGGSGWIVRTLIAALAATFGYAAAPLSAQVADEPQGQDRGGVLRLQPPLGNQEPGAGEQIPLPVLPPGFSREPLEDPNAELQAPTPGELIEAVDVPSSDVEVYVNESKLFRLKRRLSENTIISYDNERVVQVQPLADPSAAELRYVNLFGVGFGQATVRLIDQDRGIIQSIRVRVTIDTEDLERRIARILPGADVHVLQVAQNIVLEGQVPNSKIMHDVLELVRSELRLTGQADVGSLAGGLGFGGEGAAEGAGGSAAFVPPEATTTQAVQPGLIVINRVRVRGPRQVKLKVKIAELNRTALRELGVNFQRITDGDIISSIVGNIAPFGPTPGLPSVDAGTTQLFGIFDEGDFSLVLNALRQNDLARILAAPTLVTLDGQPARFLAGGSFPFPVPQVNLGGGTTITIQFRDFGAVLEFLPFILEDDMIRLDVEPVFSELNQATGTSVAGTSVPGLNERSARTVVQLREGQTLAIAGLFQTRTTGTTTRIPLLGDLPGVGPWFSRNRITTTETELLVLVTPELVEPVDGPLPVPAPGDTYQEPNDLEFYFLGRLEGRTRHDHRATINYLDPFHLIKHFRSEDHWVIGPHGFAD